MTQGTQGPRRPRRPPKTRRAPLLPTLAVALTLALAAAGCSSSSNNGSAASSSSMAGSASALAANPVVDPGSPLGGKPAPDFTLLDQFGRQVSMARLRGKAILLAFVDSRCTTICPLTTTSMLDAVQKLGAAGRQVQLIGINANPDATKVSDVRDYSAAHGMMTRWLFLTAPLATLKQVWKV